MTARYRLTPMFSRATLRAAFALAALASASCRHKPEDADGDEVLADEDCDDTDASVYPGAPEDDCTDPKDYNCDGSTGYADADADGFAACEDCDDASAVVNPGAVEVCGGVDEDCDGGTDGAEALGAVTWYADSDDDGFGDPEATARDCEAPDGHVADQTDCDDADADVNPDGEELCNGADDNCNRVTDEEASDETTFTLDADGDGFGGGNVTEDACEAPEGFVTEIGDCDDLDADAYPGAPEVCTDPEDRNCDGSVGFADVDADGFSACKECNDNDPAINPGALEVCGGADEDCDGNTDEVGAVGATTFYADTDGDGYGDGSATQLACTAPTGFVSKGGDCLDTDALTFPGASETCDTVDNNCNGLVDENASDATTWYADSDGDGHGGTQFSVLGCNQPSGYVATNDDCDDLVATTGPGELDVCDGEDNDCSGTADDDPSQFKTFNYFDDADGDGVGTTPGSVDACSAPADTAPVGGDCDDADATAYPGAAEICDSGAKDSDCNGVADDFVPITTYAGSTTDGVSKRFQYTRTAAGWLYANWLGDPAAEYEVAIGTAPSGTQVVNWVNVGNTFSHTFSGLTLAYGTDYFITVRMAGGSCEEVASQPISAAEAVRFTGATSVLRAPDALGGHTNNWPTTGVNALYGEHWFEEIDIPIGTTVMVQGWGRVDNVPQNVAASATSVTSPRDGWVSLQANTVRVGGTITASGRGYGGGGGGGGTCGAAAPRGLGGIAGVGGASANVITDACAGPGGGGGGSPMGIAGTSTGATASRGGAGTMLGGGGGATGQYNLQHAGAGGANAVAPAGLAGVSSTIGQTGQQRCVNCGSNGGAGEFALGGGGGGSGATTSSSGGGGGGGGYGGGGGGGGESQAGGGGGGGAGGGGGGAGDNGLAGAGPHGGAGGAGNSGGTAAGGSNGGYRAAGANGDTTTNRTWTLGSGGGGGGAASQAGGGGGAAGGGAIALYAFDTLTLLPGSRVLANGAGPGGGGGDDNSARMGGNGGQPAGGTVILEGYVVSLGASCAAGDLSVRGGSGTIANAGTIKLFYGNVTGALPTTACAGRVYDAGVGSWLP